MEKIKITQVRSTINRNKKVKGTMFALGLKKINQSVVKEVNPQISGMVARVAHLVTVEKA